VDSGFYFFNNVILSEYFLLQKIGLIQKNTKSDFPEKTQAHQLYLDQQTFTFCTAFDFNRDTDVIVIFSQINRSELQAIANSISPEQQILFIGHILYDYVKEYRRLLDYFDQDQILVLADNGKNPFLISSSEALKIDTPGKVHVLNFIAQKSRSEKIINKNKFKFLINFILFNLLKLLLKPKQFIKDIYATYNFNFFYGGIKVFLIQSIYRIRHISIMSFVRTFYGFKVLFIRFGYYILDRGQYVISKKYYSQILAIKTKSVTHRLMGFLIWIYFRIRAVVFKFFDFLRWCLYRLQWVMYRLIELLFRIHEFNMNYTFYPLRKFFWFFKFQYQKRILKKIND
jgi:hypothetical protein